MTHHNQEAALTAVHWTGHGDWVESVRTTLNSEGFATSHKNPRQILAWKLDKILEIHPNELEYVDGWTLERVSVQHNRWILGVTTKRIAFENNERVPSSSPLADLLKGSAAPRGAKAQALLDSTNRIVSKSAP